jgi:hypothetical protein
MMVSLFGRGSQCGQEFRKLWLASPSNQLLNYDMPGFQALFEPLKGEYRTVFVTLRGFLNPTKRTDGGV